MNFGDLTILDGVNVNRHGLEGFGSIGLHAHEISVRGARSKAAYNDLIAFLDHFLDFPFQVGDKLPEELNLPDELFLRFDIVRTLRLEAVCQDLTHLLCNIGLRVDGQAFVVKGGYDFLEVFHFSLLEVMIEFM